MLRNKICGEKERKKEKTPFLIQHIFFHFVAAVASLNALLSPCRLIVTELIETERLYVEELQSIVEVQSIKISPLSNCIISIL